MPWTSKHVHREGRPDVSTLTGNDAHGRTLCCQVVCHTMTPIWVRLEVAGKVILDGEWPTVRSTGAARALVGEDTDLAALAELCDAAERYRAILYPEGEAG
jgi:hypothetical protein